MGNHENLTITMDAAEVAGAVSYWRMSGAITLTVLTARWKEQGLDEKLLPKPVSDQVALGRAVAEQQTSRNKLGVRRFVTTMGRQRWAIVEETLIKAPVDETTKQPMGADELRYRTLVHVFGAATFEAVDATVPETNGISMALKMAYGHHQGALDSNDISSWLVKLAYTNGATSLRDSGGIYFIPRGSMDFWSKAAIALESASAHKVFRIPAMKNDEAVRALVEALTAEVEGAVKLIDEAVMAGKAGKRALKTREIECAALLDKLHAYEELLGVSLEKVSTRVSDARTAVVTAALRSGGEEDAA